MSILWALVPLSLVLILLLWYAARGPGRAITSPEELAKQTQPVDLESFRNLLDPDETDFLRSHLPPREFRSLQRERLRAAAEYVGRVSHNAAVLSRFGEAARLSEDPELAAAGRQLAEQAIRLRGLSFLVMADLRLGTLLPSTSLPASRLVESYQKIDFLAARITRIHHPVQAA
jgi:hypothetical protein